MNLARSSFYHVSKRASEPERDKRLHERLESLCEEFPRYGYRRIAAQLRREGQTINHKKVLNLMREKGLLCRPQKKRVKTTQSGHAYPLYPNLLRDCFVNRLNQAWGADITYIRIVSCFIYLAVVLDLFSRKVIGYAVSRSLKTTLTLEALKMALFQRNPLPGCIHHSDRGVQYASWEYIEILTLHGFQISMSRKGNPYDNAYVESVIKTIKQEEIYLWDYHSFQEVQERLPYFIEEVYNQKRLHSSLGYLPPNEFEAMVIGTNNVLQPRPLL